MGRDPKAPGLGVGEDVGEGAGDVGGNPTATAGEAVCNEEIVFPTAAIVDATGGDVEARAEAGVVTGEEECFAVAVVGEGAGEAGVFVWDVRMLGAEFD